jgi:hypothetical protein
MKFVLSKGPQFEAVAWVWSWVQTTSGGDF